MSKYNIEIGTTAIRMYEIFKSENYYVPRTAVLAALVKAVGNVGVSDSQPDMVEVMLPDSKLEKHQKLELGIWQVWNVDAIYLDNNQLFGNGYQGRTPLEAAINAMVERLTDGSEIGICSVRDASGAIRLTPTLPAEIQLYTNVEALNTFMKCVMELSSSTSTWLSNEALVAARSLLYKAHANGGRGFIRDWDDEDADPYDHLTDGFQLTKAIATPDNGVARDIYGVLPSESLQLLCDAVEQQYGGVLTLENFDEALATQLYQIRATCKYFGAVMNRSDSIFGNDYDN